MSDIPPGADTPTRARAWPCRSRPPKAPAGLGLDGRGKERARMETTNRRDHVSSWMQTGSVVLAVRLSQFDPKAKLAGAILEALGRRQRFSRANSKLGGNLSEKAFKLFPKVRSRDLIRRHRDEPARLGRPVMSCSDGSTAGEIVRDAEPEGVQVHTDAIRLIEDVGERDRLRPSRLI